ncbi:hypothetical protein RvY_02637 [Ramazzottius varieornatus]|uniref:Uncharacterized protein n=1 Tax=Ramazzottius varieornatus TaxID=947166 RepID=A0A1D1UR86_RAMVA|nr:hypothetical protein RvY_02637 [Ramazzottius varieornatus]
MEVVLGVTVLSVDKTVRVNGVLEVISDVKGGEKVLVNVAVVLPEKGVVRMVESMGVGLVEKVVAVEGLGVGGLVVDGLLVDEPDGVVALEDGVAVVDGLVVNVVALVANPGVKA